MLHPPSARSRVIVALRAYFDESGTHWGGPNACDVFVLGGYIATESLWDDRTPASFVGRWENVMHGKPFHATEMVINSGVIGVGGGIHIPSYKSLLLPYIEQQKGVDNPYLFLFADVICEAVKNSAMFLGEDQYEPIGFVFANHAKWSIEALQMYNAITSDPATPEDIRSRMGSVAFEDIERFIPLQAADHLAFESYHFMNDSPGAPPRPAQQILMDWPQNHGSYYNERGIKSYIEKMKQEGLFE